METSAAVLHELLPELDEHLGSLAVLFHQYLKHTWFTYDVVVCSRTMKQNYASVVTDMNRLGTLVVKLGGVPVAGMLEQSNMAYLDPEGEGKHALETMLGADVYLETVHRQRLQLTLETAHDLRELRSVKILQTLISASEKRAKTVTTLRGQKQGVRG
jgi:bacterioferritin (cytochrome b1)